MNVVIVVNNFPPVTDGVGDYSFFLANQLSKEQHDVSVICNSIVEVKNVTKAKVFPIVSSWDKRGLKEALYKIRELKPDWLLFQYVPYSYNKYGIPFGLYDFLRDVKKNRVHIAVVFHEIWIRFTIKNIKHIAVALCQRIIALQLSKVADISITSIDKYANTLRKLSKTPVKQILIPPNFDTSVIPNIDLVRELKKKIAGEKKIIVVFGIRDPNTVLKIFNAVKFYFPLVTLLICGKHFFSSDIENTDFLYFTGRIPSEEIPLYISCGNVFLAADPVKETKGGTSNKSGSLAAALYLGLPVVGTKGDMNNHELLTSGNVFLENAINTDAIVSRIVKILAASQEEITRNEWAQRLSWQNVASEYIEMMATIA